MRIIGCLLIKEHGSTFMVCFRWFGVTLTEFYQVDVNWQSSFHHVPWKSFPFEALTSLPGVDQDGNDLLYRAKKTEA